MERDAHRGVFTYVHPDARHQLSFDDSREEFRERLKALEVE